ncbi:MAG: hypothetical protein OXC91_02050 [Rhodobacteraceae bacterium]|nr:hypothetical protein [Paracoccaceae bacterium]
MPDDHDKLFATRKSKNKPKGESEHADRTPPKGVGADLSDFKKWRAARERGDAGAKKSDAPQPEEPKSTNTTASGPENPDQDAPGESAGEAETSRTADDSGKASDGAEDGGELPQWMKRRIERANKRSEALEQQNAGLREQLREAQEAKAEPDGKQEAEDGKSDSGVYDYDYPVEDDYKDAKGVVDEEAYLQDVKNWHDEKPLVGGKSAKKASEPEQPAKQQPQAKETEDSAGDPFALALSSLQAAFDEAENAPENLFQNLMDQAQRGNARISYQMLDWMADHEAEAVLLATEFVEKPRKATNIARKPTSQHKKLLAELAKELAAKSDEGGEPPLEDGTAEASVGNIDNLRTRRGGDPERRFTKAAASENYADYKKLRPHVNQPSVNVANLF